MKNLEQEKMKKFKLVAPYSSKYIASQSKWCLLPLLKMGDVVKKYSTTVSEFVEETENRYSDNGHGLYDERFLFMKVKWYDYNNCFNSICNNLELLIGKLILMEDMDNVEIDRHLFEIRENLHNIYEISRSANRYLYEDNDWYNSEDYVELFDTIDDVKSNFDKFYQIYQESNKITSISTLNDFNSNIKNYKYKLKSAYEKLLEFASAIFKLQYKDELKPYKDILRNFAQNLAQILFLAIGKFYVGENSYKNIQSKLKRDISKCFKKLETHSFNGLPPIEYIFYNLQYDDNCIDNQVWFAYQQLKQEINKNGLCHLK